MTDPTSAEDHAKPRILFVDDEPDVLAGLRSTLRKERRRFDLSYASSGHEALGLLEREPFDVVVSDMRMPQMNGAELLDRVRALSPDVVRIVLTGEAEADLVMRAVPNTHQWLSKPCERSTLVGAIDGALRYRWLLTNPGLRSAASRISSLPSPPGRYLALVEMARSPEASMRSVVELIEGDPAIAAKIVQLANSAFSAGTPITDLHGAVTRVGLDNVAQIALSVELHRPSDSGLSLPGITIDTLASLAEHAALAARARARPEDAASASLAALLHAVGLIVEAQESPETLAEAYAIAEAEGIGLAGAQLRTHGATYAQIGAHLLSVWGLPTQTVLAVAGALEPLETDGHELDLNDAVRAGVRESRETSTADIGQPYRFAREEPDQR